MTGCGAHLFDLQTCVMSQQLNHRLLLLLYFSLSLLQGYGSLLSFEGILAELLFVQIFGKCPKNGINTMTWFRPILGLDKCRLCHLSIVRLSLGTKLKWKSGIQSSLQYLN